MDFYQHSGRCGRLGVPLAAAAGLAAAGLGGLAYAYVVNWIPLVYVSFLATLAYGLAIGAAVAGGAKVGKIRNMAVTTALAALVGIVAVYFAWVFDPMARVVDVHRPFWRVEAIWAYMKLGYLIGFWTIGNGNPVTGLPLAAVWAIEAVMIVGLSAVTARMLLGERPFCEETDQWIALTPAVARLSLTDDPQAGAKRDRLLAGDLGSLHDFYRACDEDPALLQLDLASCPECPRCHFLTVKQVESVLNNRGETSQKESKLLVNLRIPLEIARVIHTVGIDRTPPLDERPTAGEQAATDAASPESTAQEA